jgi:low temperature requirement protein LtrA
VEAAGSRRRERGARRRRCEHGGVQLWTKMAPRDPAEEHRTATSLELFFDLTFAVAVAQVASALEGGLVDGRAGAVLTGYPLVFFAIWWGWMNFSWFASAYDTDDAAYRIAVLVQVAGVLILAAGVPRALAHQNFSVIVVGYVLMRLAMVSLWLRAAAADSAQRTCCLRYAAGIAAVQVCWVLWAFLPRGLEFGLFFVLAAAELAVPIWAEAAGRTPWHPRHIAERYGLFTIIVLGETLLAATIGVHAALNDRATLGDLATVVVGGLLTVFAMWWLYFDMPSSAIAEAARRRFSERLSGAFLWGYGHYVVFAAAAAVGAGLSVAIDHVTGHSRLGEIDTGLALTVPVAVYLLVVWALHAPVKPPTRFRSFGAPVAAAAILASSFTGQALLATGLVLLVLVAASVASTPATAES